MTFYLDIIFLENLFMDTIILFATGIIVKSKIKIIRILISAAIGSIYAITAYISILEIFSSIMLKVILSIVMIYIAFSPLSIKSCLKQLIIFYLTSFTFGGVAFALLYFIKPEGIMWQSGILTGTYPMEVILIGGIIGFIIIVTAFKNIKGKISKKDIFCELKININNKYLYVKAIIDTGNFLKEPITGIPVVIVEKEKLAGIIDSSILEHLNGIVSGENIVTDEYALKIRLIPFTSLGKENGLLVRNKI